MSITKDITSAVMPYLMIGLGAYLLWTYKDQIFTWAKSATGGAIETGAGWQPGTVTGQGNPVTDAGCRALYGPNWIGDPWTGTCWNGWTGEHRAWQ
jgi:hypothetical protein